MSPYDGPNPFATPPPPVSVSFPGQTAPSPPPDRGPDNDLVRVGVPIATAVSGAVLGVVLGAYLDVGFGLLAVLILTAAAAIGWWRLR